MLLCTQYFAESCPSAAVDCAISHSWCGNIRSMPPPWMSNRSPRYLVLMAEHSMCQPGNPSLHGEGQRMMCSGDAFFHSAKSQQLRLSHCPSSARVLATMSSRLRPERTP